MLYTCTRIIVCRASPLQRIVLNTQNHNQSSVSDICTHIYIYNTIEHVTQKHTVLYVCIVIQYRQAYTNKYTYT